MRPLCFIDRNIPLLAELLSPIAEIYLFDGRNISRRDICDCYALFTRSVTQVNERLLDGSSVKFVATATAGYDHIDRIYLESENIAFASAPGSNSNSVAEYVIFALLYWAEYRKIELAGKRLGIVGYGAIGKKVASYAHRLLQMEIWVNDPPLQNDNFEFPQDIRYAELDALCRNSDVVSNHVPLTSEGLYSTVNLFNGAIIELISKDGLFIHTSRGGIADENAVVERLLQKTMDAAIDVFCGEPNVMADIVSHSLLATPHIAGYSYEGKVLGTRMVAEAFYRHMNIPFLYSDRIASGIETTAATGDILSILRARRRLDHDSIAFKETMNLPPSERSAAFDAFRRNYSVRHETLL